MQLTFPEKVAAAFAGMVVTIMMLNVFLPLGQKEQIADAGSRMLGAVRGALGMSKTSGTSEFDRLFSKSKAAVGAAVARVRGSTGNAKVPAYKPYHIRTGAKKPPAGAAQALSLNDAYGTGFGPDNATGLDNSHLNADYGFVTEDPNATVGSADVPARYDGDTYKYKGTGFEINDYQDDMRPLARVYGDAYDEAASNRLRGLSPSEIVNGSTNSVLIPDVTQKTRGNDYIRGPARKIGTTIVDTEQELYTRTVQSGRNS